ncbi:hypothetical protein BC628DRAFT_1419186 [Trametes gibbosa]|nr:hypothetical protein BC628DRAFT_1419186 [Trametes gibbosa]
MPIQFNADTCLRLRNPEDAAILVERPVVRILSLESAPGGGHVAFVWDKVSYAHLGIAAHLSARIGDADTQLQVGSGMRITQAFRVPEGNIYPVLVEGFELHFGTDEDEDEDSTPLIASTPTDPNDRTAQNELVRAQNALLIAQTAYANERRRRVRLERVLRDLSARDLSGPHFGGIVPAIVQMAQAMVEAADTA